MAEGFPQPMDLIRPGAGGKAIWRASGPFRALLARAGKEKPLAKSILLEQFHVDVRVRRGSSEATCLAMKRVLDDVSFQSQLRRAIREVFRRHRGLNLALVRLSR